MCTLTSGLLVLVGVCVCTAYSVAHVQQTNTIEGRFWVRWEEHLR